MQQTMSRSTLLPLSVFVYLITFLCTQSFPDQNGLVSSSFSSPLLVKRDQRTPIVTTEFGEISAVQIGDGYHLQFITLEPNALLLPLLLHSDMVLFVHTGSGTLNWVEEESERTLELRRGDVYRLRSGSVFYVHSDFERDEVQEKLTVYAIFDVGKCLNDLCLGAYSSIRDLVLGFDDSTLRSAFAVHGDVLRKIRGAAKPPLIINALPKNRTQGSEEDKWKSRLVRLFVGVEDVADHLAMKPIVDANKKKRRTFNVFESDPDFENNNGRSIVVDDKDLDALKGSRFGVFMVNLTEGSMMAPHWNPSACEISIVLQGEGMIRVVNQQSLSSCKNNSNSERFMVEEGDVFVVPKFHPMAQMSFENSSFVFMGFSTSVKTNHPQFLVGQSSVLKVLDREILAVSFNLNNETIKGLLEAQKESVILDCVSCAEGELAKLTREIEERERREEEEIERKRKEAEERKREEEEKRRREEEEAERRRKEEEARRREEERKREEEKRRREEEEAERRRKEEEEARRREEERKREEEEAKRREEERKKREEEAEEARQREEEREREEEKAKRQEEERRRREEEEKEARKREEEREKEEEMAKKREEERQQREREEVERKKREEEARKREEEMAKRREEQERKRREEEEMAKRREQERQRKEKEEVERKRREEEAMRREEERKKEEEAARRAEEERRKREEEMGKRREQERQRKEKEEVERKRREEEAMRREEERKKEEEAARRAEEERRKREEEEAKRRWPPQPQPPFSTVGNMAGVS
ncbi:PREDICTED: vicilin-like seed storage protein At2g18540 [Camelina sativa]|uniref:Vicilin-like seed storage protein At2g18540 n=1 Tax=Camelina sativa TaxID=90675 RepID=A0ABM1RAT0_CAMSA|nr:PREDICTED: vicilin-like seed storage protein At2g18540 [Camelina sativa]